MGKPVAITAGIALVALFEQRWLIADGRECGLGGGGKQSIWVTGGRHTFSECAGLC